MWGEGVGWKRYMGEGVGWKRYMGEGVGWKRQNTVKWGEESKIAQKLSQISQNRHNFPLVYFPRTQRFRNVSISSPALYQLSDAAAIFWTLIWNFGIWNNLILDINLIQISRQPQQMRKNRNHQKFLLMHGYLYKVNLDNPLFSCKSKYSCALHLFSSITFETECWESRRRVGVFKNRYSTTPSLLKSQRFGTIRTEHLLQE